MRHKPAPAPGSVGSAIVRELDAGSSTGFDEQVYESGDGFTARPVALEFAKQLRDADHLAARLLDPPKRGFMSGY